MFFLRAKAESVLDVNDVAKTSDTLWLLSRALSKESIQTVPNWAGWVTLTGREKEFGDVQSKVEYMPPINAPVTENATVAYSVESKSPS